MSIYLCPSHLGPTFCAHLSIELSVKAYLVAGQNMNCMHCTIMISHYLARLYVTVLESDLHVRAKKNGCYSAIQAGSRKGFTILHHILTFQALTERKIHKMRSIVALQISGKPSILHQCATHVVSEKVCTPILD